MQRLTVKQGVHRPVPARCGTSMIELMFVLVLFTVVFLSSLAMIESGRRLSSSTMEITTVEDLAQQMLVRIQNELSNASGERPTATVTTDLGGGETAQLLVQSTVGFPARGTLLVNAGQPTEEIIEYANLANTEDAFLDLTRGQQCTIGQSHPTTTTVRWMGLAAPIANQTNPPASDYDGIAMENGVPVFYRGRGTGFSYRVPVSGDPLIPGDFLNGDDLFWGGTVQGVGPTTNGWMAFYFKVKEVFDESLTGEDINGDGDSLDLFDVGQIRRVAWDRTNPGGIVDDIGIGPSAIVQEQCNWGSDLDNDGFQDPIFLWDEETSILHVRLFVIGSTNKEFPIVRQVESTVFLRNRPEIE